MAGREFDYEVLRAIVSRDDEACSAAWRNWCRPNCCIQRGHPPRARYLFKHALVQEAAYASLLRRRRQELHRDMAQVLERQFPDTVAAQPELLAHHYTEAERPAQAMIYWQQAGEQAIARSTYTEAVYHLRNGLAALATLPETSERMQRELVMQTNLGTALISGYGHGHPEVVLIYSRARELCLQVGTDSSALPGVVGALTRLLGASRTPDGARVGGRIFVVGAGYARVCFLMAPHSVLGFTLLMLGDLVTARRHLEQAMAYYDSHQHAR